MDRKIAGPPASPPLTLVARLNPGKKLRGYNLKQHRLIEAAHARAIAAEKKARRGRPPDRSWASREAAEKRAKELLGVDALYLFAFIARRLRGTAEDGVYLIRPTLRAAQSLGKKFRAASAKINEACALAESLAGAMEFSEHPGALTELTAEAHSVQSAWRALCARAQAVAELAKDGSYVDRQYPHKWTASRAQLIRGVLGADRLLRLERSRDATEQARRDRMLRAHEGGITRNATAWALASILIGFEPPSESADEFWSRQKDWKKELGRVGRSLNSRGRTA